MMNASVVVALPEEELDRLYRVCSPPYRAAWAREEWQAILSCNRSFDVWPTTRLGYNKEEEREVLPLDEFPHLRRVMSELLRRKRRGGRIFVRNDVIYYSPGDGKERLCEFGVIAKAMPVLRTRSR